MTDIYIRHQASLRYVQFEQLSRDKDSPSVNKIKPADSMKKP